MIMLALLLLSGCATVQNNHDPIERVNRTSYSFNDGLDKYTLKPLARGYVAAMDPKARKAISNFYDNAAYPNTIINDFLQGKGTQGMGDILRFVINSTVGLAGLIDVAIHMKLKQHNEDFGQTLAVWGFSQGAYIVYPFFGPSSVRDTPNLVAETAVSGLFWVSLVAGPEITIPLSIFNYIDKRSRLLDASDMRDELALDPYIFTREAWRQNREFLIHDGNPPKSEKGIDDDWKEDEWGSDDNGEKNSFAGVPQLETRISSIQDASPNAATPPAATSGIVAAADEQMLIINIASFASKAEAFAAQRKLSESHIQTGIIKVSVQARTWYRLYSRDHVRKVDAKIKLAELKARSGYSDAWLEPVR